MKLYHGTCDTIDRFDIYDHMGMNTGNNGGAIFLTSSPLVASAYSRESFIRKNEYNDDYKPEEDIVTDAWNQQHIYEVDVDTTNALELDIRTVYNKWFKEYQHRDDVVDANLLNHIINILQNRCYERNMECYDEKTDCEALEILLPYLEEYNEELDDYVEKDVYYNCIIVKNCIDSIDDESHWIQSDIVAVLDENILRNVKYISSEDIDNLI